MKLSIPMATKSKIKGNKFEREIVNEGEDRGFKTKRAYASNGQALGECEETDLMLHKERIQAKRRAKIAKYMYPPEATDGVAVRADREDTLFVVEKEVYYHMLACKVMIAHLMDIDMSFVLSEMHDIEEIEPETFKPTLMGEHYDKIQLGDNSQ